MDKDNEYKNNEEAPIDNKAYYEEADDGTGTGYAYYDENSNDQPYSETGNVNPHRETKNNATVAMILGILALVFSCKFFFFFFAGLILAIIAVAMGASGRKTDTQAKAGWIMGIIALAISGLKVIALIGFFAMPLFPMHHFMYF